MQDLIVEKELVKRVRESDSIAFERLYNICGKAVYYRVLKILKDPDLVDEVVQNLFLKLWNIRSELDENKNIVHLMCRIADNMAIDEFRKIVKNREVQSFLVDNYSDFSKSLDEEYFVKEKMQLLNRFIDLLPPQRRLIYRMNKIDGHSYREISEELDISESTISNHLVLATKFLKKKLVDSGDDFLFVLFLIFF